MKLLVCLLPAMLGPLAAQSVIPNSAPASYSFDGWVHERTGLPPTFPLHPSLHPSRSGGRQGSVWIRHIPEGLLIAGSVDGPAPDFAAGSGDKTQKDRVEIWLAPPPNAGSRPSEQREYWSSTNYCRKGMTYKECGHKDNASPPARKRAH